MLINLHDAFFVGIVNNDRICFTVAFAYLDSYYIVSPMYERRFTCDMFTTIVISTYLTQRGALEDSTLAWILYNVYAYGISQAYIN